MSGDVGLPKAAGLGNALLDAASRARQMICKSDGFAGRHRRLAL